MGRCGKHWKPGHEYKIIQGGGKKPIHPPTEFGITPISLRRQSVYPSHSRDVENRKVCSKERRRVSDAKEKEKDKIGSSESLIAYCNSLDLNIVSSDESLRRYKISDDTFPRKVIFAVKIKKCYSVEGYRGSTLIQLTDILKSSFQYKFTLYSQLCKILEKVETSTVNIQSEMKVVARNLCHYVKKQRMITKRKLN